MDTVFAVISNRFYVMAQYSSRVVARVYRDEMCKAAGRERTRLKRIKRILVREESLLDEETRQSLTSILNENDRLNTIYCFRQRLQDIWKRSTGSHESLLNALQVWCSQAEETGIIALRDFSTALRGYAMQPQRQPVNYNAPA